MVSYNISSVDFPSALNTTFDRDKLRPGVVVMIYYPDLGVDIRAKVIQIQHDLDGHSLTLTIANMLDIQKGSSKIMDLLKQSISTSTQVDMSKFKWDQSIANSSDIHTIMTNKWNANKLAIEGGDELQYRLDTRGLTIKNPSEPSKFLRAVNSVLAITNDGGNTYKNAITSSGVVAEQLFGTVIAGANLTIQNTSGSFSVDGDGVTISDMDLNITTLNNKNKISVNATEGFKIQKNSGTTGAPNWTDQIMLDTNGDAQFGGNVIIGSGNNVVKWVPKAYKRDTRLGRMPHFGWICWAMLC